jgi:excisionase family DNA binding protein
MSALAPTLEAFFTQRLIAQRDASPRTVAAYRDTLRLLLRFASERTPDRTTESPPPAYTVTTLAAEIGQSERSIRAAVGRGELQAVKRGRGYLISADAVADWARGASRVDVGRRPRSRSGPGPMARAIR